MYYLFIYLLLLIIIYCFIPETFRCIPKSITSICCCIQQGHRLNHSNSFPFTPLECSRALNVLPTISLFLSLSICKIIPGRSVQTDMYLLAVSSLCALNPISCSRCCAGLRLRRRSF